MLRSYRRLGLAKKLMLLSRAFRDKFQSLVLLMPNQLEEAMAAIYRASHVSLHVRKSNRAALNLYTESLGFTMKGIEKKYCEYLQIGRLSVD